LDEGLRETGFAIISDVVPAIHLDQLLRDIAGVQRSRAGIRHAMNHPSVAAIANSGHLLEMAQSVLGLRAFPIARLSSTSLQIQIGWWYGT
jgi:hypothetical protein